MERALYREAGNADSKPFHYSRAAPLADDHATPTA